MKKISFHITIILFTVLVVSGCKKSFDDLNDNPNKPTSVPPSLLLNGVLNDMVESPYTMKERWCQYYCCNYDYYGNNEYNFGSGDNYYVTLKNVIKMEEEAVTSGLPEVNAYTAMASFLKAYLYTKMTLQMGDIPVSESEQGVDNLTPAYDAQKDVFLSAFEWLEAANTEFATLKTSASNMAGDIFFDNDLSKWQKTVNTYYLRLLINLSKKSDDADLNLKGRFTKIVNDPVTYPVMESSDDNLQYTFLYPTNPYPMNPGNFGFDALRYNMSATYVGMLTKFNDPRVFVTSEPASALVNSGTSPTSFDAFVGANPGEDLGTMYAKTTSGNYSLINRKYFYDTYTGEPSVQIGFPEMCFNIAEAINRGWITKGALGTAEDYYKAGIKASMASYGIPETGNMAVYFLKAGASLGTYDQFTVAVNFDTYYAQPLVKYAGNTSTGLTEILEQKYLALFRHSGLESYFTWRRTGVPTFTTGAGTGNSERIALRFKYDATEQTVNTNNYQSSLNAQFNGNDDINAQMWLLK